MDHDKKLAFIHKMTKMGLDSIPHYAIGGPTHVGGFLGIGGTDIQQSTDSGQINQAYGQAQNALNQSGQVASQLEGQTPQAIQAQAALSQQLQAMTQGKGPNPALNQLNQATGANVANQAALMAGQRGAAANPALIARQAAQQGAATQQQAAGQAATQMAQQQIAAQQNLAGLSANQVNQAGQAATSQNQAAQNEQGQLLGANANFNNASIGAVGQGNQLATNIIGGLAKGASAAAGGMAKGGPVKMADGGSFVGQYLAAPAVSAVPAVGAQTDLASAIPDLKKKDKAGIADAQKTSDQAIGISDNLQMPKFGSSLMAKGGSVNAVLSPDEVYLSPDKVQAVLKGADPMKVGQRVPGKAKVKDDSLKNDTVPAELEEGGVVIPRHITRHKMAPERAAAFVHRVAAKKGLHR